MPKRKMSELIKGPANLGFLFAVLIPSRERMRAL
jgi:hypothetical protein